MGAKDFWKSFEELKERIYGAKDEVIKSNISEEEKKELIERIENIEKKIEEILKVLGEK